MTLFETVLDLGFEDFAVISPSTSIYHNLGEKKKVVIWLYLTLIK